MDFTSSISRTKEKTCGKASQLLAKYRNADSRCLKEIVTSDETWLYFSELDSKENNKVWIVQNGEWPQIARRNRSVKRIMYAHGIVGRISVPKRTGV